MDGSGSRAAPRPFPDDEIPLEQDVYAKQEDLFGAILPEEAGISRRPAP
ncbi:MAG: hypothetical protein P4N41_23305 [Negativicutes bacterium]|nr:hypothetical protein [Negativicutes bacterium]